MSWIKIFITHSTKTEEAQEFLDAVKKALDLNFDVRLDQTGLKGGDDWRAKLYQWMEEVHGAVLLLTKEALESKFVQMEAMYFTWRKFRQPGFVLLPVTVGEVTAVDLAKGIFGEMALNTFQAISLKEPALAAKVACCLISLKGQSQPRTPREVLQARIVKLLRKEASEDDLREVGVVLLGWTPDQFTASTDYYEKFARELLQADRVDAAKAFAAVTMLADAGVHQANELLEIITPNWVAPECANPVAELAFDATIKRALSLNTAETFTAHSYIGRSCYKPLTHGLPFCELQEPTREDSFADLRDQILAEFKSTSQFARKESSEFIKKRIEQRQAEIPPKPVYVLFPPGWVPDAELFDALRNEFQTVTFFVLAGDAPPEKLAALQGKVKILAPLDPAREQAAIIQYANAYADVNK